MHPRAARLIEVLDLAVHPEGGWYRETWRTAATCTGSAGERSTGTGILYLLADGAVSCLHRLAHEELWCLLEGGPVALTMLDRKEVRTVRLDAAGATPLFQAVVPASTWFGAELEDNEAYALLGCVMAPGFEFADFELGRRDELCREFPDAVDLIRHLTEKEEPR